MKKILLITTLLVMAVVFVLTVTACGSAVPERLTGSWQCDEYSSGNKVETGFYTLDIESDGTFSLNNESTGNADLSGSMKGDDTGKIGILELSCQDKGFNPPECWSNIHKNSRVRYKILDDKTIKLGYVGIWMVFRK